MPERSHPRPVLDYSQHGVSRRPQRGMSGPSVVSHGSHGNEQYEDGQRAQRQALDYSQHGVSRRLHVIGRSSHSNEQYEDDDDRRAERQALDYSQHGVSRRLHVIGRSSHSNEQYEDGDDRRAERQAMDNSISRVAAWDDGNSEHRNCRWGNPNGEWKERDAARFNRQVDNHAFKPE